jgi:alkanesulfonate monooxygenase SsuD/methylene tetrahydromethanopterin reductase-like flavin-dependent oxidoreductase (luciferase family)
MRFALMIEAQQGLSYEDQLAIARRAEAAGFEAFFRSDHYTSFPGPAGHPTTDAWAVLAGLARETSRITLGALVSPVTFRQLGNFVKLVTTVDHMAGGRLEVAVGAGWNEDEHAEYGLPFPPIGVRADMLEEQLALLHGLWTEPDGWNFDGRHLKVRGGRLYPRPVDLPGRPRAANGMVRPRLICGGEGTPRGLRIAARWADEFNLSSSSPERARAKYADLAAACQAIGRDFGTLTRSAMVPAILGVDADQLAARESDLIVALGQEETANEWFEKRRHRWILGQPEEARAMIRRYADAGVERIMLQDFLPHDLEMIDLMAAELIGKV